jgi:DnaJ-class molecular chaperone
LGAFRRFNFDEAIMGHPYIYKSANRICGMCGESMYDDMDYCESCEDHTTVMIPCEECDGTGEIINNNYMPNNPNLIDRPYKKCQTCAGEGYIEE